MSFVLEKLIENWLDNQTERKYQPAFVQMLVALGWEVLHNTRHSQIELGKDVIARDPEGRLFAFQLKGNPGTRIKKSEAGKMLPQIRELLLYVPEHYRKTKNEKHYAVLLTNGGVDEEANLLFSQIDEEVNNGQHPAAVSFERWSRGTFLTMLKETITYVWPTSISGTKDLLTFMTSDGREIADFRKLGLLFDGLNCPKASKAREKNSSIASILFISELAKYEYYSENNHYSLFLISVLAVVSCMRHADSRSRIDVISKYSDMCIAHAIDLLTEAKNKGFEAGKVWFQSDPSAESDLQFERQRILADVASIIILHHRSGKLEFDDENMNSYLIDLVHHSYRHPQIWGYAAAPSIFFGFWALSNQVGARILERNLAAYLRDLIYRSRGKSNDQNSVPPPYYDFETCWAFRQKLKNIGDDSIFEDNWESRVWFLEAIFLVLVSRNCKVTCKEVWYDLSKVDHHDFDGFSGDFFSPTLARRGKSVTKILHEGNWNALVEKVTTQNNGKMLDDIANLDWVIAAYISIVPYRAWTEIIIWLNDRFGRPWYSRKS